jgi:hypothetical protein
MIGSLLERLGTPGRRLFDFEGINFNDLFDGSLSRRNTLVTHGLVTNITVTYVTLPLL